MLLDCMNHEMCLDSMSCFMGTPPLSPEREVNYDDEIMEWRKMLEKYDDIEPSLPEDMSNIDFSSYVLLQDCMWSGIGYDHRAHSSRRRTLSEKDTFDKTKCCSTNLVDPTTSFNNQRQHNQVEHNYCTRTPEPFGLSAAYHYGSPATTDDSESEEDLIDVVTVDTRARLSSPNTTATKVYTKHSSSRSALYEVKNNLHSVAQKLSAPYKRKRMSDHDFMPSKKSRRHLSTQSSLVSSQNNSDNEDCEGRRSAHNVMERHRRNELKNSLHDLRDSLPSLESQERAPKVVILAHATDYIRQLKATYSKLDTEYSHLKDRNTHLKERLEYLQSLQNFN